MISHCETRGGGISLCLIRANTVKNAEQEISVRKGTLRTIANALQLVLRPMDQIARYDDCTFAIAILYNDQSTFNPDMFERSTASILKHTHLLTDQGKRLSLSISNWHSDQFDPPPEIKDIFSSVEKSLSPIE